MSIVSSDSATGIVSRAWPGTATEKIVRLPNGVQDIAWLGSDLVVCGVGSTLQIWRRGTNGWSIVADFRAAGPKHITRLAISPDQKWIAFVADDANGWGEVFTIGVDGTGLQQVTHDLNVQGNLSWR